MSRQGEEPESLVIVLVLDCMIWAGHPTIVLVSKSARFTAFSPSFNPRPLAAAIIGDFILGVEDRRSSIAIVHTNRLVLRLEQVLGMVMPSCCTSNLLTLQIQEPPLHKSG